MPTKSIARLQTPADVDGNRVDIHLVTDADAVIYDETDTVKSKIEKMGNGVVLAETKPEYACLWGQVMFKTDGPTSDVTV